VKAKVDSAFSQLFYGHDSTQRAYYPVEPDMAYIEDIYDGLLYMLAMLQVSGNFRIYDPTGTPILACPEEAK